MVSSQNPLSIERVVSEIVPILECRALTKTFGTETSSLRQSRICRALDNVDFSLERGKNVLLIGASGAGKSTLARCLALMEKADSGQVFYEGAECSTLPSEKRRRVRSHIQLILQSTAAAMNPKMSAREVIEEPLRIKGGLSQTERGERAEGMMQRVGFPISLRDAQSSEISGGQRQRLALGRALMLGPKVLILDEALTGLEFRSRSQLLDLLIDLQQSTAIAYLFISHNVGLFSDLEASIWTMSNGGIRPPEQSDSLPDQSQH